MASTSAITPVSVAVINRLKAVTAVTDRVPAARITDDAAARIAMPYILVQIPDESPNDTMGATEQPKWGQTVTVNVSVVSQYRGDADVGDIKSLILGALNGFDLVVSGFPSACIDARPSVTVTDTINGVTTRQLITPFEVMVHQ